MSEEPAGEHSQRALLAGGLLSLVGFLLLTAIVAQPHFARTDLAARSLVRRSHHPALTSVMEEVSVVGGRPGQVALLAAGFAVLWRGRRRWALGLPLAMAGAGAVQHLAKWAVDRPRPNLDSWGFPSAHVLSLVVLLGYLAYAATLGSARPGPRRLAMGAGAALVAIVAFSRMYLDAHFLSDILGGLLAGLAYLSGAIWAIGSAPRAWRALRAPRPVPEGALLVPASPGSAAAPLVAAVPAVAIAPATPAVDTG